MMLERLQLFFLGSVRRQLNFGITLVVALMMALFIWDITYRQEVYGNKKNLVQANALVDSLAASTAIWTASRDYSGLQEIVQGLSNYPNLKHVLVYDLNGHILAHNDVDKIGFYLAELPPTNESIVVHHTAEGIDITKPISLGGQQVGWARIGIDLSPFHDEIRQLQSDGVIYVFFTIFLSALITSLVSRYLVRRLNVIQQVADEVQEGANLRVALTGNDEAARLAQQFNSMLDSLAHRKAQLASFYSLDLVGFVISSPDNDWIRVNTYLCEMLEYSEQELQNMNWTKLVHPDDLDSDIKQREQLKAREIDGYKLDLRFISRTEKVIFSQTVVRSVLKPSGDIDYFITMIENISERKKAEEELSIAATVFESQEGMMVTDASQVILRVNKAFTKITGYRAEEVVGKTPKILSSGKHHPAFYLHLWNSVNDTGTWNGEIWNKRKNGEIYPQYLTITSVKDMKGSITSYVATLTDITMRKLASEEIENLAFYDPLTKLPNRRLMLERISHALANTTRGDNHGALIFLDIDNFKTLNDTMGHNLGDLLLQQVAERLTSCLRESDTAARIGGDEFVVLLENLSGDDLDSAAQAKVAGNKILAALNKPYTLDSHIFNSSASIGIALFNHHHSNVEELLGQADIAMYQAKSSGRNTLRFFDPKMQDAINKRALLENDLRIAIEQQQFELYYQIQVDQTGQCFGAEALIRWHHPKRGLVSPFEFISVAEDSGLILPIGQWVLETACAQLHKWQQQTVTEAFSISINVSARQLSQPDFVGQVKAAVERYAINPSRLNLELTESSLLKDIEDTIIAMKALQAIGVHFELDDFGTGYSSLQYLKKLPLYQLKIDKSFVRDVTTSSSDQAIIGTIIAVAKSLRLRVIAEGVETERQRQFLLKKGCNRFQGYMFSKPLPISELETMVVNNRA